MKSMKRNGDQTNLPRLVCFLFLLSATGCSKFALLDLTIPAGNYLRTSNLSYGPLPRQKLDVYQPRNVAGGADVVIFFYGGDWQNGEKGDYRFVAEALTSVGFVAVLPDYRLYPQAQFPAFVQDGAMAVRWVHDHIAQYGGKQSRIFLMGHSAGAHIAALLTLDGHYLQEVGLKRSDIRATAGLAGPYYFVPYQSDRAVFGMSPDDRDPDPRIEPINFVDGKEPPMLLVQGRNDDTVNVENAIELAARIRELGGEVQTAIYPGKSHVDAVLSLAWSFRWLAPTLHDVTVFFRKH